MNSSDHHVTAVGSELAAALRGFRLAVLLVCRNRRETTLACLRTLTQAARGFSLEIVLFDDASTDGTPEAVSRDFPGVYIEHGDGKAFWNGGLYRAWRRAETLAVDGYLWLNDDVELGPGALASLAEAAENLQRRHVDGLFVVAGATRDPMGAISYGGMRRRRSVVALGFDQVAPDGTLREIDTFNGNFVFVPSAVAQRIGFNDSAFFHNMGDIDYGLRAKRAGISVYLLPDPVGVCPLNRQKATQGFGGPGLSLRARWRMVNTHHGLPFASWWRLTRRHSGVCFPLHFLLPYRRLLLPRWPSKWGE